MHDDMIISIANALFENWAHVKINGIAFPVKVKEITDPNSKRVGTVKYFEIGDTIISQQDTTKDTKESLLAKQGHKVVWVTEPISGSKNKNWRLIVNGEFKVKDNPRKTKMKIR